MSQANAILLLGSNMGSTEKNILTAIQKLEQHKIHCLKKTNILTNEAVEYESTKLYSNIAIQVSTNLSPIKLLKTLKKIEVEMGRLHDTKITGEYTDRIIDIDIVTINQMNFESNKLQIPHYKHTFLRDFSRTLINELNSQ